MAGIANITYVYADVLSSYQVSANADITFPLLFIDSGAIGNITRPLLSISSVNNSILTCNLPLLKIDGIGTNGIVGNASFNLPLLDVNFSGSNFTLATGIFNRPLLEIDGAGSVSVYANASMRLPLLELQAFGYSHVRASANITLPLFVFEIQSIGYTIVIDAEGNRYRTNSFGLSLNTENNGLSEYYNYRFNSFAFFNGQYLGANEKGIYVLLGDSDDGSNINAEVKTSLLDYNDSHQKRIHNVVLGIDTDDTISVSVNNEQYQDSKCDLVVSNQTGLGNYKYKTNKGTKGRYWSVRVKNVSGADFSLDNIQAMVEILSRTTK